MSSSAVSQEMQVNVITRVTMRWVSPLIAQGYRCQLTLEDIPRCEERFMPPVAEMESHLATGATLTRVLIGAFWREWVVSGLFRLVRLAILTAIPFVLRAFVGWLSDPARELHTGVLLALAMGALPMLDVLAMERTIWLVAWTSTRIRTALVLIIFRKVMRKRGGASPVEVGNLISTDVDRVKETAESG